MTQRGYSNKDLGWNGEPRLGVGEKPRGLIGQPFHPDLIKVTNVSVASRTDLTAHAVSHEGLANNHKSCKNKRIGHGLEPLPTAGREDFLGPAMRDRGRRGGALVFLQI